MSSGYGYYVVESAEVRERRLLVEATTRRNGLLDELAGLNARRRVFNLAETIFHARSGDSAAVNAQCEELQRLLEQGQQKVRQTAASQERETARRHLEQALQAANVAPNVAAALQPGRSKATTRQRTPLAELAEQIVQRQLVADPAIAQQVATAVNQPQDRAELLLRSLRDEVERRNANYLAAQQENERLRRATIEEAAQVAGQVEENRLVSQVVQEALAAIGYQISRRQAVGHEDAMLVTNAAFPHHAVLARTNAGRIHLDAVRVDGSPDATADHQAEDALCQGLAAFREELRKRGLKASRVSHLPAGIRPLARVTAAPTITHRESAQSLEQRR